MDQKSKAAFCVQSLSCHTLANLSIHIIVLPLTVQFENYWFSMSVLMYNSCYSEYIDFKGSCMSIKCVSEDQYSSNVSICQICYLT